MSLDQYVNWHNSNADRLFDYSLIDDHTIRRTLRRTPTVADAAELFVELSKPTYLM